MLFYSSGVNNRFISGGFGGVFEPFSPFYARFYAVCITPFYPVFTAINYRTLMCIALKPLIHKGFALPLTTILTANSDENSSVTAHFGGAVAYRDARAYILSNRYSRGPCGRISPPVILGHPERSPAASY